MNGLRGHWAAVAGALALAAGLAVLTSASGSGTPAPAPPTEPARIHLELEVELDPAARTLSADARVRIPAGQSGDFALAQGFEVEALSIDGVMRTTAADARSARHALWRIAASMHDRELRLRYHGPLAPLDTGLDHRGVLRGLPALAGAEGAYLPAGAAWYPLVDGLFSYRLDIHLPAGYIGVAPGRLVEEAPVATAATGDSSYRAVFEFPQPADGIDLMVGPYGVAERMARLGDREVRLRTYFHADLADLAQDYLRDSEAYLRLYDDWIGPYPFAGFSVVASPLPTGFGMPGLTYLGREVIRLPFIRATSLGHEILHNWWGNGVYPDWASGNWSEGLTTYMADYHFQARLSPDAAREARRQWLRDYAAVPPGEERSLVAFTSRAHAAAGIIGYGKAAMVFHMLRERIGGDAFDAGIRHFWRHQQFRVAGWRDLQAAFEQASGQDLADFFQQWLTRTGAPDVQIVNAEAVAGGLRLRLTQGEPAYRLDLPLRVRTDAGEERHVVALHEARADITLTTSSPPRAVRLDAEFDIWRHLAADEIPATLRQVMLAPGARVDVAEPDAAFRKSARALAARLLEGAAIEGSLSGDATGLLFLRDDGAEAELTRRALPAMPTPIRDQGDARAYAVARGDAPPVLVISARDATALASLTRALPHYGRQSYVVFERGRALQRGIWPAAERWVEVRGR